jgi:hypothetical protein
LARNRRFENRDVGVLDGQPPEVAVSPKEKGQAIPLPALTGPEGSRWLKLPDFKTIGT